MVVADNVGIFAESLGPYLDHVRSVWVRKVKGVRVGVGAACATWFGNSPIWSPWQLCATFGCNSNVSLR